MSYENRHPFGIDPSEDQISFAIKETKKIQEECPATTCCNSGKCCQAGMPNLYYSEWLAMRRGAVDKMTKAQRVNLTVECVRRYLQDQKTRKPCAFLSKDNMCTVYDVRPLKCRTYGLIPPSLYDIIVGSVSVDMGVPREELPLCTQCPDVKVKTEFQGKFPTNEIPTEAIKRMESMLKELDRGLGMKKETQDQGFGFLTYHDWHLLFEFGEVWMENLSKLRLNLKDKEKDQFINALKTALESKILGEEKDGK